MSPNFVSFKPTLPLLVLALLAGGLLHRPVLAADAGSEIRRFQDETRQRLQAPHSMGSALPAELPPSPSKAAVEASSARTHVAGFQLHGVTCFSQDELIAVLKPYVGQTLDTAGIHAAANALKIHYRNAGYFLAKVFIPPQTFGEIIRLDVEEGYLERGGIEVENKGKRVDGAVVRDILERHLNADAPVLRKDMERALLIAEDLPGVTIGSVLYPGQEVGTARLRTVMNDEPLFSGNIDFDNFGNEYTGRERLGTTLYLNSPSGAGDQAVARLVTSGEKSNYAYLTYLRPVSSSGTRLGASLDYFRYDADPIEGLGASNGFATDARLYLTHPLIRSRYTNLNLRTDISHLRLADRNDLSVDAERTINSATIALYGDETHDWLANGITLFDTSITFGHLEITGDDGFKRIDADGAQSEGGFTRFNFNLQRLQHVAGPWSLYGKLSGQLASTNLGNSQKYYLGGGTSVSGYPVGEAGGDQAVEIHAEVRREVTAPWGGQLHGSLFYQQGWLQQHKSTWDGWNAWNPEVDNHVSLKTAGLGATQTWDRTWVLRGLIGWQLGENPVRNPLTGNASDGKDEKFRAWVQVVRYF